MTLGRREFLRLGGVGLAAAGLDPGRLFGGEPHFPLPKPLLPQLLDDQYPFPYDSRYFECAERVYNVRRMLGGESGALANIGLVLKPGKTLDIRVLLSDRPETLPTTSRVLAFNGVQNTLDLEVTASEGFRLYYQVQFREGSGAWAAHAPRTFKLPTRSLEQGGEVVVLLIGDDHTFDDADYAVPAEYAGVKLSGDYVNTFLKTLRTKPNWAGDVPLKALRNGFTLAQSLRHIMAEEDPDLILDLGDANGIGANYKWPGFGISTTGLTDRDYNWIAQTFWLRMRKMYSLVMPNVPYYMALGNHDGEEVWNTARFRAKEWRLKLCPWPDWTLFSEGGHPEGNYYGFSLGTDKNGEGGARFLVLDVTAFCSGLPRRPEEWTLGESQLRWFEKALAQGGREWTFACLHHVLGGWPAGPDESRYDVAYGRGPLFTAADYAGIADPAKIEQVKLTEMAVKHGLNAFLYGHDHISAVHRIGKTDNNKDLLGICAGSTKYVGEAAWWKGPFWTKHYGNSAGNPPQFWGPPGITKLVIRDGEMKVDFIKTGTSAHSNHPFAATLGTVLSRLVAESPPASLALDRSTLTFTAAERGTPPPHQSFRVLNRGARALRYRITANVSWLEATPPAGATWGEADEISVAVNITGLTQGTHTAELTVDDYGVIGNPQKLTVTLELGPPPLYAPLEFKADRRSAGAPLGLDRLVFLSWKENSLNRGVKKYRLYLESPDGTWYLLEEFGSTLRQAVVKRPRGETSARFGLRAADAAGREGPAALTAG